MDVRTLRVGDKLILEAVDINSRGQGVAKAKGYPVIFVDGLLPKESAEVEIVTVKRDYAVAKILKLLRVSPLRMDPLCPHYDTCGGCQLQHLAYPHQFHFKLGKVLKEMELKLGDSLDVDRYFYSVPLRYRNKATFHIRGTPEEPKIGYFKMDSHQIVDIDLCLLTHRAIEEAYMEFKALLRESTGKEWVLPYDESDSKGLLKNVTFRVTYPVDLRSSSEISSLYQVMLILSLNLKKPSRRTANRFNLSFLEDDLKRLKGVSSIILDFNPGSGNRVLGGNSKVVKGRLALRQFFITNTIGDIAYFYGPYNFFQVNPWIAGHMIDTAVEWLGDLSSVMDLYCGVGTFGIALAKAGVKKVLGVEVERSSKSYIKRTLTENSISPDRFNLILGKVEDLKFPLEDYEAVVIDPPRKGLDPDVIKALSRVKRILYFSCSPSTLIRDLVAFKSLGFSIVKIRAFDMFPQTTHLELGVLLQR